MTTRQTTLTGLSLLLLAVLFIALVMLSDQMLRGWRVDLTENRLYTLSPGTRNILTSIEEPITLYFFFSDRASRDIPMLRSHATRVRELLDEFVLASEGRLRLQTIDPLPFSEQEDRAAEFGLQGIPLGSGGDDLYLGLAGTNRVDGIETIPFFQPDREAFLEYELARLVHNLTHPHRPVVGLLSSLNLFGGFDPLSGQPELPWIVGQQLTQLYDVLNLDAATLTVVDENIDLLLLVHPKVLPATAVYAIDQFLLRGGRALIFVDPHAEIDPGGPGGSMGMFTERTSNLAQLFAAWGLDYDPTRVVADRQYALSVQVAQGQPAVRHLGIVSLDAQALDPDDVITGELSSINLALSGFLDRTEDAPITLSPLLHTSEHAMPLDVDRVRFLPDPSELQQGFQPTGERYVLAARIGGEVPSAFPGGPPASPDDEQPTTETDLAASHRDSGTINAIVVADVDILTDRLWVQTSNFFGQQITTAWANNGDFVINAVDNLLGDSDLLSLRGRATTIRPFTRVQALQREADERLRSTEQALQAELRDTETRINDLQQQRGPLEADDGLLILSPAQQAEVDRLRDRMLEIRQELRQVRRDLDRDIERLGTWLKVINIGLMPLLVTLTGLLVAVNMRRRRRRTAYH